MKYLTLMLIMLLVAYPVIELTKLIAVAGPCYWLWGGWQKVQQHHYAPSMG